MVRRVLVTGASGFIGRWSIAPLLAAGYEVHAVVQRTGRELPAALAGATVHCADLLREDVVESLVGRVEPSHLLHFAWIATPGVYWNSPQNPRWLAAGRHLLQCFCARGGVRAVVAGTCAEYDWSRVGVCDERASPLATAGGPAGPGSTPYVQCKLAMHRELADFGRAHGISTAWGRIFFQYGPDEHPDRLVASIIINLFCGRDAPCSHGRQVRSFLHAADVGAAFAALLDGPVEGPVNIGSGERIAIAELIDEIGRQIGRPELVRWGALSAPPAEPPLLVPDIGRLRDEVGWRPRFSLQEGIADTIDWWRGKLAREVDMPTRPRSDLDITTP